MDEVVRIWGPDSLNKCFGSIENDPLAPSCGKLVFCSESENHSSEENSSSDDLEDEYDREDEEDTGGDAIRYYTCP